MSIDVIARAGAGPFVAACALLVVAGASKIRRPIGTGPAAGALGLPSSPAAVRTFAAAELGAGLAGLAFGAAGAAAVAVVYAALAVAAWRLFTRAPGTPCGCLGAAGAPATRLHVVVNVAAATVATLEIAGGPPLGAVGHGLWSRVAFVVITGCCAWLVASMLDTLPALAAAVREGGTG